LNTSRQAAVSKLLEAENAGQRLKIGIIQGTLGRQGNPKPVEHVYEKLSERHECFIILMSEVIPAKLALFKDVDLWVQFACPRLSIDWGDAFTVPILTPYEAMWSVRNVPGPNYSRGSEEKGDCKDCSCKSNNGGGVQEYKGHPMDYYAHDSLGPHTPNFMLPKPPRVVAPKA
jgi:2-(3-amino-3-carboxypropyl)histidine synthase